MNNEELQNILRMGMSSADNGQFPQSPGYPQTQSSSDHSFNDVQGIVSNDIRRIQKLVDDGVIDNTQGQYLVNYVINKAQEFINGQNTGEAQIQPKADPFAQFEAENAGFFKRDGRAEVLEYLKRIGFDGDKDEISMISQMIEKLENGAVDRYLKQTAHEKTLNDENEIAKQRLRANAQNSTFGDTRTRAFTREQIGRMSGAEFAKYEKAIMEQLRKGLIK